MFTDFVGNLACSLSFGHSLVVVAKTIDGAKRFKINLRTSKLPTSDIGLQLHAKFTEDIIIRRTMINEEWLDEERVENLDDNTALNPIVSGDFFVICIFAGENSFHISVNNRPYCIYNYRLPIENIHCIEICEQIQTIKQVDHRASYPYAWPPIQTIWNKVQFNHDVPIMFLPGHIILLTGLCFGSPKGWFTIKFFEAGTKRELLHFNPRFPNQVVVRNAMKPNLEFGEEERSGGFPFVFDQQFTVAIAITEKEFLFAVDGRRFCNFVYRSSDLLQNLVGIKVTSDYGMFVNITAVDHFQMPDKACVNFESFCK
ncbi:32 kDa beta-galactoside-binding lectin [Condylostylus longicornis]|uniref:32 kDa beta-galactoside-binding lectin n=1 Tax=Condylostylus longicornis TaxID=2530218 RepID=UPI00244DF2AA|nr:32 kDa beta-galactoside-binding lectin [Condylostylus longicornis]